MTARLRAVTEATEIELLRAVAAAIVEETNPRRRLNAVVSAGLEAAVTEAGQAVTEAHHQAAMGAQPGYDFIELQRRTRRRLERAFLAVLVDATRLHARLARMDRDPDAIQAELNRAAASREGCRVRVQDQWWSLTSYCQVVVGSASKRAAIWGSVDRG